MFVCMCVCVPYVCVTCRSQERTSDLLKWGYRWSPAAMWALELSSLQEPQALSHQAIPSPELDKF